MDPTRVGFWFCMDNNHDMLQYLYVNTLACSKQQKPSHRVIYSPMGTECWMVPDIFLLSERVTRIYCHNILNVACSNILFSFLASDTIFIYADPALSDMANHCHIVEWVYIVEKLKLWHFDQLL